MIKLFLKRVIFFVTPFFFYSTLVSATAMGIDFNTPTDQRNLSYNTWTMGYSFMANADLTLTELGYFDSNKDGLYDSHQVGLFDDMGNLLTSGFVDSNSYLDGWFRWADVLDVNLILGEIYSVMGIASSEFYAADIPISDLIVDPNISFLNPVYNDTNLLVSGGSIPQVAFFGANIKTFVSSVPEPSLLSLLTLGVVGMSVAVRKKV